MSEATAVPFGRESRDPAQARNIARRIAAGLCPKGGCLNPPAEGHRLCWEHFRDEAGRLKPDHARTVKEWMRAGQAGVCPVCGEVLPPAERCHLDHDRTVGTQTDPGSWRGLLHPGCNTGLGKLGDDEPGLLRALRYVRRRAPRWHTRDGSIEREAA